eukprot:CAMPEP_0170169242 /NCGR_PEP_ID=MMETSP0040_2-20121228/2164_1 /TAXON_ID=641309 /ORGANISM="Lotharella oceanica, Strain CCMP622" /LENGTH=62 /DNA_ID=CAMNT_0010407871 /DNA_START=560 /DNA_END=748 /DNA_ORIENTATION=+
MAEVVEEIPGEAPARFALYAELGHLALEEQCGVCPFVEGDGAKHRFEDHLVDTLARAAAGLG